MFTNISLQIIPYREDEKTSCSDSMLTFESSKKLVSDPCFREREFDTKKENVQSDRKKKKILQCPNLILTKSYWSQIIGKASEIEKIISQK